MSKPLNNNTNIYHNKQQQPLQQQTLWRKPELQIQRPLTRESDVQRLKQSTKENHDIHGSSANKGFPNLSAAETLARKKKFATYKFYLDNLEPQVHKRIERGIRLLGATMEAFFSSKCTHLITTKTIPLQENLLQTSSQCDTNASKPTSRKSYSDVVERALQMNIALWSSDVMLKTLSFFLEASCGSKQIQEKKRALGKVLQEEKLFGPSTGANSEAQAKRPQFIPFKGHFLIIEDTTQVHRPPIQRQYTKEVFTKRQSDYPWPFLKTTQKTRSPFGKRTPPNKPDEGGNKENQPAPINKHDIIPPTAAATADADADAAVTTQESKAPRGALAPVGNPDSQQFSFRASGFQPSCTATNNTQSASTRSASAMMQVENRRLPPGESVNRLDKRMIENVALQQNNLHKQAVKAEQQNKDEKARREREQRRKRKDLRFCENCNVLFENLEEHIIEKTHQMYVKDQNNFKNLDELLEKTYRVYKSPLPDHMKNLIDVNIDGKNVKFMSDLKRSHPTPPPADTPPRKKQIIEPRIATTDTTVNDEEGWGKYHAVFL